MLGVLADSESSGEQGKQNIERPYATLNRRKQDILADFFEEANESRSACLTDVVESYAGCTLYPVVTIPARRQQGSS